MAKAKYEYWAEKEGLLKLSAWSRDGLTDEQIAGNMNISTSTLYDWKKKHPEISEALKKGKEVVDIEVENSLFKKATGFTTTVKKPMKLKTVKYDKAGKRVEKESVKYVEEEIYVPPDTTAQIFWLKNRRPDIWRDKQNVELSGIGTVVIADDLKD